MMTFIQVCVDTKTNFVADGALPKGTLPLSNKLNENLVHLFHVVAWF